MSEKAYWNAWLSLDLWHLSHIAKAIARATAATASAFGHRARAETPAQGVGLSTTS